ncbi:MAG: hypothetical protein A2X13_09165 [Bacteroidetes bacterium GWC2_33_15]|nr:MAG: hypothetical protein A2X10_01795 [Bacteroidetes bacterium GWA2_33_15]OFX49117.1 MAG: hypothetical protein A2X13_09165 [Bacteroidetes bacterium GWC2_33_15]OFX64885.1 MAG: hypothetical protein A2X15_06040 [Bacteroidetes bacterium GWB2_32_14]OFX68593.1 MAG: hypothetical protein A2X14_14605 [Bacteroidetes bacterium GWD2_33_33]HAN17442.1 hypothetical protein [Bacteroidales bacterium]
MEIRINVYKIGSYFKKGMSKLSPFYDSDIMPSPFSGHKILVVDDDDVSYFLINEIFASYNLEMIRAYNGFEAMEYFKYERNPVDLVLMDIRMPEMNGYEATRRIKVINPSMPVIALTAYAHTQGRIDCLNAGCDEFVSKPFDINSLLKIVEKHLS